MDGLLTPLTSTSNASDWGLTEHVQDLGSVKQCQSQVPTSVSSLDEALQILQSNPSYDEFLSVLVYLDSGATRDGSFNIKIPGPKAAQLINTLVGTSIPDFWNIIDDGHSHGTSKKSKNVKALMIRCLTSVTGLGALVAQLRSLITLSKTGNHQGRNSEAFQLLAELLTIMTNIIGQKDFFTSMWADVHDLLVKATQRIILWKEFISFVAASRILSTAAEAEKVIKEANKSIGNDYWIANGNEYSKWIGQNVGNMAKNLQKEDVEAWTALARLLSRSFSLGYTDLIVERVYIGLLSDGGNPQWRLKALLSRLMGYDQRKFLSSILRIIPKRHLKSSSALNDSLTWREDSKAIGAAAALLNAIVDELPPLRDELGSWLTSNAGGGVGEDINIRRVVVTSLSRDEVRLQDILEKSMQHFGDKLYIKHTPVLHQEVTAQILLLAAGYVHRSCPMYLFTLARSTTHLSGISNRLSASSLRARFLGMVVGVAISELIDKPDKRMAFSMNEMDNPEARWYRSLTSVKDEVGSLKDLALPAEMSLVPVTRIADGLSPFRASKANRSKDSGRVSGPKTLAQASGTKIISIEEIGDDNEAMEDEFIPYEKPDSDEEDEDEDPTLVQRNKPTAPVYVRDLIAGLRDLENYDRHRLALSTSSSLIRRKATFGTEVADHAEDLASLLVGLNDKFEMENFERMRLQGMIAILVAQPSIIAPWFAKTFFDGDFSMSQRASILSTLGMGARELAGHKGEDGDMTGASALAENVFPSKMLPENLHKVYAVQTSPVDALAKRLERTMIEPMALEAADKLSGPNALKVRTFSARMEIEKKRKKPIANVLAKMVAQSFIFPLTGRWWTHLQAYGNTNVHFSPFLLTTYLKTLSIILHASGASTLSLPQMTSEFWDLLLSLRSHPANDPAVVEALLFALLTLLEINEDKRRLAQEQSKELLETQEWVEQVFGKLRGGDEEGERSRMLAASVLMKIREVVEKYQRLLLGDMVDL
ncbi:MAG: telomere binding protein [Pycnora praestabilis]|nr:MAG: telomere binding protein [Pycnora praestabilis]